MSDSVVRKWLTPEWTYVHYTDQEILQFFEDNPLEEFPDVSGIFTRLTNGANKACFFRVYHMLVKGGVFLDSDAMLSTSIENVTRDYSFFTVVSGAEPDTVFNGFMGSEPGHPIVYEAVKYLYYTHPAVFNKNYFLSCYNLYSIIHKNSFDNIKLYYERPLQDNYVWGSYDGNVPVAFHYPMTKLIPEEYLRVYDFDSKIRLGGPHDNGYVIADGLGDYDCYLSCGVGADETFSRDFISRHGMNETNSFAFDGTIDVYPWMHTTNVSFVRKNISDICDERHTNLDHHLSTHKNVFLKMDIEGHEYRWILHTPYLKNVKQCIFEFHDVWTDGSFTDYTMEQKRQSLEKLSETHILIHAHGNNYAGFVNNMPSVMEFTYIRKDMLEHPCPSIQILPVAGLDAPNDPLKPDYFLGFEPFTSRPEQRVAVWIENNWAFGRIAQALRKYAQVDIYDWRNNNDANMLWVFEKWKDYDCIITTSIVFDLIKDPSPEACKRLFVLTMHGEFGDLHFRENIFIREGIRYGGICKSVCQKMLDLGYPHAEWIPWGVDVHKFKKTHTIQGPIRRIGLVAQDSDSNSHYGKNKGYDMFQRICDASGCEAVYIRGRSEECIYDGIDMLVCTSRVEGGPFGILEAAARGIPVMSTAVGNMKDIDGLFIFETTDQAVEQIKKWNNDTQTLISYSRHVTDEVVNNWTMKQCVDRLMRAVNHRDHR
jgi:glycosyltransferase involved in cell wall biosynthesis